MSCASKRQIFSLVWFRQDLRLSDNQSLLEASLSNDDVMPIYILDDCAPNEFKLGGATKVWLHFSLENLDKALNGNLNLYVGDAQDVIAYLARTYSINNIFCNACYEPWHINQQTRVAELCRSLSIHFRMFNSNYINHPNQILKNDGSYYKVFTAYKNKVLSSEFRQLFANYNQLKLTKDKHNNLKLHNLNLLPKHQWHQSILNNWTIGEAAAHKKLDHFTLHYINGYKEGRNHPSLNNISRLSPHLHFGEISPSQILHHAKTQQHIPHHDLEHFTSEIIWREFSCHLLYHFNTLHLHNFNRHFDHFKWEYNHDLYCRWQKGMTGYPFVDAGMRELWQTGYMHNRVRMVVASFLVKNLNIPWSYGMRWFWDCLVDADLANNSASWQWVAGSGVDAAPYFRIFNPISQGEKFDSNGAYTKRFVPELQNVPDKYLFRVHQAPDHILKNAGVILGDTYPFPIVDLDYSRNKALNRYQLIKNI